MLDNRDIESHAADEVKKFFRFKGFIKPYIDENDKTPLWDGNLFVYSDKESKANEYFKYKIPVQVKGKWLKKGCLPEMISHAISKKELQKYRGDGGVLFFKVVFNQSQSQIYFRFLNKAIIDMYLRQTNRKSHSVCLIPLSEDIQKFIFDADAFHLQQIHSTISPEELQGKSFNIVCDAVNEERIPVFIARHARHLLVRIDNTNTDLYLEMGEGHLNSYEEINLSTSVNEQEFFSVAELIHGEDDTHILNIGECLTININRQEKGDVVLSLNISLEKVGSFKKLLHELRFLNALADEKKLTLGSTTYPVHINNDDEAVKYWRRSLSFWEKVETLLGMLNVYDELDIKSMTDNDYKNLNKLIRAILYNDELVTSVKRNHVTLTKIANLSIYHLVVITSGKKCRLRTLQDSIKAVAEFHNGERYFVPVYSKLFREEILPSNIDFKNFPEEYGNFIDYNPCIYETANWDVLVLLNHYDKNKSPVILEMAEKLLKWIINNAPESDNDDIYYMNELQIKKRKGYEITSSDKQRLYLIAAGNSVKQIKWGAYVLLGDFDMAKEIWHDMSERERNDSSHYPITGIIPTGILESFKNSN